MKRIIVIVSAFIILLLILIMFINTKHPSFSGTIYRNNYNYVDINMNINPSLIKWIMTDGEKEYFSFSSKKICNDRLKIQKDTYPDHFKNFECKLSPKKYNGIGKYYLSEADILSSSIYYLKQDVENNVIISAKACLNIDNKEFCLNSNYWEDNGTLTLERLRSEMESAFERKADSCHSNDSDASCNFDNAGCDVNIDGSVHCYVLGGGYCFVLGANDSNCKR